MRITIFEQKNHDMNRGFLYTQIGNRLAHIQVQKTVTSNIWPTFVLFEYCPGLN